MKLFAISDLHVGFRANAEALATIRARPDDWVIIAGDVAEHENDLRRALEIFCARYRRVIWVPGNHELWTTSSDMARGENKYLRMVECCRELGVVTPEDPYPVWDGEGGRHLITPLFLLYDYSFADDGLAPQDAVERAGRAGIRCADEDLLHPDPFASREAWCEHRCRSTEARLEAAVATHGLPLVMINHFPLKREFAHLPAIPPFKIWCGTRRTETWASRFKATVVVSGHLHLRSTRSHKGTRYEEVSLGYPHRQWDPGRGIDSYIRQVLPSSSA